MNKRGPIAAKKRESNFELLRLIVIGLVILSHFSLWSFPLEDASTEFSLSILLRLLFTAGCIANIIFISPYLVSIYSQFSSKRNLLNKK